VSEFSLGAKCSRHIVIHVTRTPTHVVLITWPQPEAVELAVPFTLSLIAVNISPEHIYCPTSDPMGDNVALPFPHPRTCPTRAEVFVHKNVINSIERDIVNTTKEINRLQAHLQYLQQRKANHTSYISPLRCFSPELLSEVVNICLDSDVKLTTLTQVCGTIRDMVVGMSSLWKKILIRAVHPQPMSNLVNQTWVSRSPV
jgi:hypothetical protein